MEIDATRLPRAERLTLALRTLYERRGYRRYRMSNFESYDIYRENKNFLENEGIVTFSDASGRLMALKPDVTMSIVKNTKPDAVSEKLYYIENVFRTAGSGECREISQMGLESIGGADGYAQAEVVALAAQSLEAVGGQSVLSVSHMGFVTGLMDEVGLPEEARGAVLAALRGKNGHGLCALAKAAGCGAAESERLARLAALAGPPEAALAQARALAGGDAAMGQALDELEALCATLCAMGDGKGLQLDFSVIQDIDYYNGLVFRGYVRGVPRAVLSGGRYDNLMHRLGKPQAALGFALYLGELERALRAPLAYDVDVLLLYGPGQSARQVALAVRALSSGGASVRAERVRPAGLRAQRVLRLSDDGRWEEIQC